MRPALPMRLPRSLAWLCIVAGLTAAILADEPRPRKAVKSAKSASAAAKSTVRVHGRLMESAPPAATSPAAAPAAIYSAYHVEFADADSCNAFHADGVWVLTRFDRFLDVIIKKTDDAAHNALDNAAGLVWYDIAMGNVPTPPPVQLASTAEVTRAAPEGIVRGGIGSLTGRGVIVALIDSGIDFRHPDFITQDASGQPVSRVRYLWDTLRLRGPTDKIGAPSPVTLPDGTPLGTIYSRDDLTADLRRATPQIPDIDECGHGTACAGIAAGTGAAFNNTYRGVAPDADIIMVRIADKDGKLAGQYLIGSILEWFDKVAGDQPLVVSCSIGTAFGGRDGCLVQERQIDARFPLARSGRAICVAAGNEAAKHFHGQVVAANSPAAGKLNWTSPNPSLLQVYVVGDDPNDLQITPGDGVTLLAPNAFVHPLSQDVEMQFSVPKGKGSVQITSKSSQQYQVDAYLVDEDGQFDGECAQVNSTLDSPGTSTNVITVGSYNWNDKFEQGGKLYSMPDSVEWDKPMKTPMTIGQLSEYSSLGYRRFGTTIKPEIVGPGQFFTAPAPLKLPAIDGMRDTTLKYQLFNGTSAATPYVAGLVALAMQANPKLTFGEIKDMLRACTTDDKFTGPLPNTAWGYGKLDLDAATRLIKKAAAQ